LPYFFSKRISGLSTGAGSRAWQVFVKSEWASNFKEGKKLTISTFAEKRKG